MKIKKTILSLLLLSLSISIVHEYIFTTLDTNKCSVIEYVHEHDRPIQKGDICDIHYEYHHSFIVPQQKLTFKLPHISFKPSFLPKRYISQIFFDHFKPPKA